MTDQKEGKKRKEDEDLLIIEFDRGEIV